MMNFAFDELVGDRFAAETTRVSVSSTGERAMEAPGERCFLPTRHRISLDGSRRK
jgi:hypothetical protein